MPGTISSDQFATIPVTVNVFCVPLLHVNGTTVSGRPSVRSDASSVSMDAPVPVTDQIGDRDVDDLRTAPEGSQ